MYKRQLDNHPKALAAGYDVRHSRLQFSVAKGNLYPSISVGGGYSTNFFMNLDDRTQYAAFPAQFRDNRGYYFSAQLSIPIFGGLSRRTSLNRAPVSYTHLAETSPDTAETTPNDRKTWQKREHCSSWTTTAASSRHYSC